MRFTFPVLSHFRLELADMKPKNGIRGLDFDGICNTQIGRLTIALELFRALQKEGGWEGEYDDEKGVIVFENKNLLPAKNRDDVINHLKSELTEDSCSTLSTLIGLSC